MPQFSKRQNKTKIKKIIENLKDLFVHHIEFLVSFIQAYDILCITLGIHCATPIVLLFLSSKRQHKVA